MSKQLITKRKDVILNYLATGFRLCNSFILLPFLLVFLSSEELGLWYVYLAIYGFVVLFQAGFAPTFARNIVYCWSGAKTLEKEGLSKIDNGEVDFSLLKSVVLSCRLIYATIGIASFIVLLTVGSLYIFSISENIDQNAIRMSWIVFCLGVFLNLVFSYCESLVRGVGDITGASVAIIVASLSQLLVSSLLLVFGFGILGASSGFFVQGIVFRFICMYRFDHFENLGNKLKVTKVSIGEVRSTIRAVSRNALKDTFVSISSYLSTTANTLICSTFFSLSVAGNYSVSMQIINAAALLAGTVSVAFQPSLQSAFSNKDLALAREICGKVLVVYHFGFWLILLIVFVLVMPILEQIKQGFSLSAGLMAIMAVYFYLWKHHSVCASLISNSNSIPYMTSFIISSFAGVALSLILVTFFNMGIFGLMVGQIVSQAVYNNWKWPKALASMLGTKYFALLTKVRFRKTV